MSSQPQHSPLSEHTNSNNTARNARNNAPSKQTSSENAQQHVRAPDGAGDIKMVLLVLAMAIIPFLFMSAWHYYPAFVNHRGAVGDQAQQRTRSRMIEVKADLADLYTGKEMIVSVSKHVICPHCHGTGADSPESITECPHCHGCVIVLS